MDQARNGLGQNMMLRKRHAQVASSRVIGKTLRLWRAQRGLTLRAVAAAAREHAEPIGFDYLSRLENGELMPSVPKLSTLARVYEHPLSDLVALYESVALRRRAPKGLTREELQSIGLSSLAAGDYPKALACFQGALDAAIRGGVSGESLALLYDELGNALTQAGRHLSARQYLEDGLRAVETAATRAMLMRNLAAVHAALGDQILADILSLGAGGSDPAQRSTATAEG